MSDIFHQQSVKKSRKRRICAWCGTYIEIGQPYKSYGWRDCGDSGYCYMHPECLDACNEAAAEEGGFFLFSTGDFHRGCTCQSGHCECVGEVA